MLLKNKRMVLRMVGSGVLVISLIAGIAFAAFQSKAAQLTGSTIQTSTAGLQISTDGTHYADSQNGFTFSHIVPGGTATVPTSFYLRNTGDVPLFLKMSVANTLTNPDRVDLSKVMVIVKDVTLNSAAQTFSLQALEDGTSGGSLVSLAAVPNEVRQFQISVSMDADAVSGQSASIGNIDMAFTGTVKA